MEIWDAETVDELHRALVLCQFSGRGRDASAPYEVFEKHHVRAPGRSLETAVLLLTDRRWRDAVAALIAQIDEGGLLASADLDVLATTFLAAGRSVYWEIPQRWFDDDETIQTGMLALPLRSIRGDPTQPAVVERQVRPPLRRWATARLLRRDPTSWSQLVQRGKELDAAAAAAVMCGLLDASDVLAPEVRDVITRLALPWPHRQVRLLALARLVELGDPEAAYQLASHDSAASIRSWATKHREAAHSPSPEQSSLF